MPTDSDTRSAVAEAFAKAAEPVQDAPEPAGDAAGEVEATLAVEPDHAPATAGRDEKGRFAKGGGKEPEAQEKPSAPAAGPATAGQGAAADGGAVNAAPALSELKPPQDWRAGAKEEFAKAPRAVQEEAIRLYGETRKTLDRAAALEKEIEPWKAAVAPYEHMLRVAGVPPAQAVGNLLRTYAALQSAPATVRAQIVADLIRNYVGTDEAALTLVGKAIEAGGGAQPRAETAPVGPDQVAEMVRQQIASERATSARDAAVKAWQEFEPSVDLLNEDGVRQDLADLAGRWSRENPGQAPSKEVFQKLYDRACSMNEKAAAILKQRKDAAAAKAKNASTSAGAAAASGVKNEPAGPSNGADEAKDTREEVERQFKKARQARV